MYIYIYIIAKHFWRTSYNISSFYSTKCNLNIIHEKILLDLSYDNTSNVQWHLTAILQLTHAIRTYYRSPRRLSYAISLRNHGTNILLYYSNWLVRTILLLILLLLTYYTTVLLCAVYCVPCCCCVGRNI